MPGPGGGGHGGGGGRSGGGFGGGSHGGGGFGGGHHGGGFGGRPGGGFHGGMHHMGGWHYRPRYYGYGGGGCCGSIAAIPFLIMFVVFMLFYMVGSMFSSPNVQIEIGDTTVYDEVTFQDFADAQYAAEFDDSGAYEDNLLIVFLTDEDYYDYNYIAWVGDHIVTDIDYMLGNNYTELGRAMESCINESNYKYSLDSNLADVMDIMTKHITELELESSYDCTEEHAQVQSHLTNYTDLPMTEETVNEALANFTQMTGIPVVIVVEDMADVFGSSSAATEIGGTSNSAPVVTGAVSGVTVLPVVVLVVLAVLVIVLIAISRRKKNQTSDSAEEERNKQYRQFDDQY